MFDKKYISPAEALKLALASVSGHLDSETVRIEESLGRIAAEDIYAGEDLPGFARSSVDGFAVIARDTYGAKESLPAYITSIDEVFMGQQPVFAIKKGQAARIPTGGMLPEGADAIVMIGGDLRIATLEPDQDFQIPRQPATTIPANPLPAGRVRLLRMTPRLSDTTSRDHPPVLCEQDLRGCSQTSA